jgi:hypothetical protein
MTSFAQPVASGAGVDEELLALAKLEATCNAIRLRIASLAPDQLYRGTSENVTIAELISEAVEREKAYLAAFRQALAETNPQLEEPRPGLSTMDRDFSDDLAAFFDLRRMTLDVMRTLNDADWQRRVTLPDGSTVTLEWMATTLQRYDAQMLQVLSRQRHALLKMSGVDELRDQGTAGKLGQNLAQ